MILGIELCFDKSSFIVASIAFLIFQFVANGLG